MVSHNHIVSRKKKKKRYRQSFLMRAVALRVMLRGKSTASMPLRMMLYVFMGSNPVKGGVPVNNSNMRTPNDQ